MFVVQWLVHRGGKGRSQALLSLYLFSQLKLFAVICLWESSVSHSSLSGCSSCKLRGIAEQIK
jgi:hypothetical protein